MNRFRRWLIHKLGGFILEDNYQPKIEVKLYPTRHINSYMQITDKGDVIDEREIHLELCRRMSCELIKYTKLYSKYDPMLLLTDYCIHLDIIDEVINNELNN